MLETVSSGTSMAGGRSARECIDEPDRGVKDRTTNECRVEEW